MRRQVRKSKILPMKYRLIYLILGAGLDYQILEIYRLVEHRIEEIQIIGVARFLGLKFLILLPQKNLLAPAQSLLLMRG